jgi:hypothetical protein
MAVTQVTEHEAVSKSQKSSHASRQPGAVWTTETQLWRSVPMVRMLAEIWSNSKVSKIEVLANGAGIQVHVVMSEEDRQEEYRIYDAERAYLNSTKLHSFDLHVSDAKRVRPSILEEYALAGFQTILER